MRARGNLGAVIKAILLDPEARDGNLADPDFGKLREPVVRLAHLWRALDAVTGPEANGEHRTADFAMYLIDGMAGQSVQHANSVFNFYLPDNPIVPGGERLSPEMQILSESNLASTHNDLHHRFYRFTTRNDLSDDSPRVTLVDLEPLVELANDRGALLDRINLLFYAGGMPDPVRAVLGDYLADFGSSDAARFAGVRDVMFMIATSSRAPTTSARWRCPSRCSRTTRSRSCGRRARASCRAATRSAGAAPWRSTRPSATGTCPWRRRSRWRGTRTGWPRRAPTTSA